MSDADGKHVLVVDDEEFVRLLVAEILFKPTAEEAVSPHPEG